MVVLAGVLLAMALLGIGGGFFLLVFAGPLGTPLSVPNLIGCLAVAVVTALLILGAGTLLDGRLAAELDCFVAGRGPSDRKSTRLNSSHMSISYAVFCLIK